MADTVWTTVKVRRSLLDEATGAGLGASNAGAVEHALRRALETEPNWSRGVGGASVPQRAPVAQRIEGQTTVDEMLASCPQCAGELEPFNFSEVGEEDAPTVRCVDCLWVREPAG